MTTQDRRAAEEIARLTTIGEEMIEGDVAMLRSHLSDAIFAALQKAREEERERCAKMCDEQISRYRLHTGQYAYQANAARDCAAAIRALPESEGAAMMPDFDRRLDTRLCAQGRLVAMTLARECIEAMDQATVANPWAPTGSPSFAMPASNKDKALAFLRKLREMGPSEGMSFEGRAAFPPIPSASRQEMCVRIWNAMLAELIREIVVER